MSRYSFKDDGLPRCLPIINQWVIYDDATHRYSLEIAPNLDVVFVREENRSVFLNICGHIFECNLFFRDSNCLKYKIVSER